MMDMAREEHKAKMENMKAKASEAKQSVEKSEGRVSKLNSTQVSGTQLGAARHASTTVGAQAMNAARFFNDKKATPPSAEAKAQDAWREHKAQQQAPVERAKEAFKEKQAIDAAKKDLDQGKRGEPQKNDISSQNASSSQQASSTGPKSAGSQHHQPSDRQASAATNDRQTPQPNKSVEAASAGKEQNNVKQPGPHSGANVSPQAQGQKQPQVSLGQGSRAESNNAQHPQTPNKQGNQLGSAAASQKQEGKAVEATQKSAGQKPSVSGGKAEPTTQQRQPSTDASRPGQTKDAQGHQSQKSTPTNQGDGGSDKAQHGANGKADHNPGHKQDRPSGQTQPGSVGASNAQANSAVSKGQQVANDFKQSLKSAGASAPKTSNISRAAGRNTMPGAMKSASGKISDVKAASTEAGQAVSSAAAKVTEAAKTTAGAVSKAATSAASLGRR